MVPPGFRQPWGLSCHYRVSPCASKGNPPRDLWLCLRWRWRFIISWGSPFGHVTCNCLMITKMALTREVKMLFAFELWIIWFMECTGVEMRGCLNCKDLLFIIELILCLLFFVFRIWRMFIITGLRFRMCGRPLVWWWQCFGLLGPWSMQAYRRWLWILYHYH